MSSLAGERAGRDYPYNQAWLRYAWRTWLEPVYEGGLVLDLATGIGVNGAILRQLGARRVVAVDLDWGCLRLAQQTGLPVLAADLRRQLPLRDASVELVLLVHVIEHFSDGASLLHAIRRVLRTGGRVVVVTPDWRRAWRTFFDDPTHVRPYSRPSLDATLEGCGFRLERRLQHNVGYGLGRTQLWRALPRLCFTGDSLFAIGRKRDI